MKCDSGINWDKMYAWAEPAILTRQDVRRIGVVIPEGSMLTPDKLRQTAAEMAMEGGYKVVIEWRRLKEVRDRVVAGGAAADAETKH